MISKCFMLIMCLIFSGRWLNFNSFNGLSGFLSFGDLFLENRIINILKAGNETIKNLRSFSFSTFTIGNKHFIILSGWKKKIKRQFIGWIINGITIFRLIMKMNISGFKRLVDWLIIGIWDGIDGLWMYTTHCLKNTRYWS